MTDREKLVEIVCNAIQEADCISHCNHPPCYKVHHVVDELISHCVTVREMQKPLTVEESREMPDVVWVEWSFGGCEPRIPSTIDIDTIHNIEHYSFTDEMSERLDDYGKIWRCWASKPTVEERKAAEWER